MSRLGAAWRWLRGQQRPEEERPPPDETTYSRATWSHLTGLAEVGLRGQGAVVEAMHRVVSALNTAEKSAGLLGQRIWWLNFWLLVFTVAICVLTAVLVWLEHERR